MKIRSLWRVIAFVAVAAMVLTACAPAATQAPAPTAAAAQPTQAAPAAATEPAAQPTVAAPTTAAPAATTAPAAGGEFTFGMLYVGPYNDHGWSQANYDGGKYVESKIPGTKMIYIDKANNADRPGTTVAQLAEELVSKGAKMVFFTSDDMKDGAVEFTKAHPEIPVVFSSGDTVWKDGKNFQDFPNMANIMGRMEYGKMMAGCAAALTTKTGQIGFLGPLINDETRRLAASAYLGAKYCWTQVAKKDAAQLKFKVTWIGFWFNIPGVTSDPTQVADDFYNSGYDVVISGIDTTEALTEADKLSKAGKDVKSVAYDFKNACSEAESVCLGVPWFNWGPSYVKAVKAVQDGTFKQYFEWSGPDWKDINNPDSTMIGFEKGSALSADASAGVDTLTKDLAGGLNLWKGPLNLQDGTVYLKDGETATDQQIWYLPQLLQGMEGQSVPSK